MEVIVHPSALTPEVFVRTSLKRSIFLKKKSIELSAVKLGTFNSSVNSSCAVMLKIAKTAEKNNTKESYTQYEIYPVKVQCEHAISKTTGNI